MTLTFGTSNLSDESRKAIIDLHEAGYDQPGIRRELPFIPIMVIKLVLANHRHEQEQAAALAQGRGRRCHEMRLPGGTVNPPIDNDEEIS